MAVSSTRNRQILTLDTAHVVDGVVYRKRQTHMNARAVDLMIAELQALPGRLYYEIERSSFSDSEFDCVWSEKG
jgi:hypothetical protein